MMHDIGDLAFVLFLIFVAWTYRQGMNRWR